MAPGAGSLKLERDGGDDNHGGDNNSNNNNDGFGKNSGGSGSGSGSGSIPPKEPPPPSPPFKVITHEVTVTRISTAVQTATIFLSSSSGSSSSTTISATSTTQSSLSESSTSASAATSSFSALTPVSSSTDLNTPPNSSAQDGSPTPRPTPMGTKTSLPLASIISIILGCLFVITLCFVIYVRRPRFPRRFRDLFRRRHTPAASTIGSFEPKEFRDFSRNANFRRSARSFVALPDFYLASNQAEASTGATFSPQSRKVLLALNAPSYESSSYKSRDSYSQEHRIASSEIQFPEVPPSRSISVFDEYPFEHDATDIAPNSINGRPTEERSSGFPQSVHDMTVE